VGSEGSGGGDGGIRKEEDSIGEDSFIQFTRGDFGEALGER